MIYTNDNAYPDAALADARSPQASTSAISRIFASMTLAERMAFLCNNVSGGIVLTTSFGLEDQVLTHLLVEAGVPCRFVTVDTGRLFPETHAVWAATEDRYGIRVEAFHPRADALDRLVQQNSINGFYHSVEARHACCAVRKLEPLAVALLGASVWLTGLRAEQSGARQCLDFVSYDTERQLLKINPLLDLTRDAVVEVVQDTGVPINALHEQGFLSIGCAPCTRAVAPGEPERAGRWWWEQDQARECGLHLSTNGRPVSAANWAYTGRH